MRDYLAWHEGYDDDGSGLSWRLQNVRSYITALLDTRPGPLRAVSACAGDGRDILGVLADRGDAQRVEVTLIEVHPVLAEAARRSARDAALPNVEVRVADAGNTTAYLGAVPADLVLLVGIFGNISLSDVECTVRTAPQLCAPGATLVWSRSPQHGPNDAIRGWFAESGFVEVDYAEGVTADPVGLGCVRLVGDAVPLAPGRRLFTFRR
jgi:hypothetical protein